MPDKSGKTLTIFVVLLIVLLASSTSIGFFLYNKEMQLRKSAETERDAGREAEAKTQAELKETKKQLVLLQDKNKEADEKINNLLDEAELNDGLRNELKKESAALKEQIDGYSKVKDKMKEELDDATSKLRENQALLAAEQGRSSDLSKKIQDLQDAKKGLEVKIGELRSDLQPLGRSGGDLLGIIPPGEGKEKIDLDRIVVSPQEGLRGHILSVDKDVEFVVINLGAKQGVKSGDMLSIYRGEEYLGDVKATRVQEEMSAADIIPPFSSRKVRKNDSVVLKQ